MARLVGRLSQKQVEHAKPKGGRSAILLADGGNLYLQCTLGADDHVRRSWVFRFELDGKCREMGLGALHTVGLKEARAKARELRLQLLDGIDPLDAKQKARMARLAEAARTVSFQRCAELYIKLHRDGWKHPKHLQQWEGSLARYVYPAIGAMAVSDINSASVLKIVEPMWASKTETAARVRGRIELVLDYATASGFRSGDNPARHVLASLPKQARIQKVRHFAALKYQDIATFMAELRQRDHIAARALELTVLCATRTNETLGAAWDEFDLKSKTWTIAATRMKSNREHRIPLSGPAVELLKTLPRRGRHVFSAGPREAPLSDTIMVQLLKRMRPGVTVHGFRSAFRDWCSEQTNYPSIVAEMALAHSVGSAVEKAYRRGDLFEKRRKLMDAWASYCARPGPSGATVTLLRSETHGA